MVNNEQSILASVGYRDTYPELIRLVSEQGLDLTPVITSTVALDQLVSHGFQALLDEAGRAGQGPGRPGTAPWRITSPPPHPLTERNHASLLHRSPLGVLDDHQAA
jgi:(R,R)-butanediol dehydrogenase / meso-butanediol dehydrogenase / diacetyl reductase